MYAGLRPAGAKASDLQRFCPCRAKRVSAILPRALPWAMGFQAFQAFFRFAQQQDSQAISKPLNVPFGDETVTHKPPNTPSFCLHIFPRLCKTKEKVLPVVTTFIFYSYICNIARSLTSTCGCGRSYFTEKTFSNVCRCGTRISQIPIITADR